MTHKNREKIIQKFLKDCEKLRTGKGKEYAIGADANANFKSDEEIGVSDLQSCLVFMNKSYRSIRSFVRNGRVYSEPIDGRIADVVNYLCIFKSLLNETKTKNRSS